MRFKNGDRVHVTKIERKRVNFYATLTNLYSDPNAKTAELTNCSDTSFEGECVYLPDDEYFGSDKVDYFTLVTDEEDSEEPEVQHISGKNYLNTQFVVEVNKGVYVQKIKGNTFKFTKNIEEALFFSYYFESIADDIVEQLNGKKYEVVRYMEG